MDTKRVLFSFLVWLLLLNLLVPKAVAIDPAKIKKYNLSNILATYTTYFDLEDENRSRNIKLAVKKIDGKVLKAGESFSFNNTVGPRTKERGFKKAIEIVNNKYVTGIGGGICQVSSTLYNSVLSAGLKILERDNHSRPVSYIPLGRGATVYYDLIDFKFKNNYAHPIMITARVINNQLTISLLGTDLDIDVKVVTSEPEVIEPEVIKKKDTKLAKGSKKIVQESKVGYKVTTKRIIKSDAKVIEKKVIKDIYPPVDKIVKVNPKNN